MYKYWMLRNESRNEEKSILKCRILVLKGSHWTNKCCIRVSIFFFNCKTLGWELKIQEFEEERESFSLPLSFFAHQMRIFFCSINLSRYRARFLCLSRENDVYAYTLYAENMCVLLNYTNKLLGPIKKDRGRKRGINSNFFGLEIFGLQKGY